jgi:hypothetical protein
MVGITPSPDQLGYAFGNFVVFYLIGYAVFLRKMKGSEPAENKSYNSRIIKASALTSCLYALVNLVQQSYPPIWGIASLAASFAISYLISLTIYWFSSRTTRRPLLNGIASAIFAIALLIGACFPLAFISANASARKDFVEGIERQMKRRADGDMYMTMIRRNPDLLDELFQIIPSDGKPNIGDAQKRSSEIFSRYLLDYYKKASDSVLADVWDKQSAMISTATAVDPTLCQVAMNAGFPTLPPNSASLSNAIIEYNQSLKKMIEATELSSPIRPVDKVPASQLIVKAAGLDLIQKANDTKLPLQQQCFYEASIRSKTGTLTIQEKAQVARLMTVLD